MYWRTLYVTRQATPSLPLRQNEHQQSFNNVLSYILDNPIAVWPDQDTIKQFAAFLGNNASGQQRYNVLKTRLHRTLTDRQWSLNGVWMIFGPSTRITQCLCIDINRYSMYSKLLWATKYQYCDRLLKRIVSIVATVFEELSALNSNEQCRVVSKLSLYCQSF